MNRSSYRDSTPVQTFGRALVAGAAIAAATPAVATVPDPRYGATVEMFNPGHRVFEGQVAASGRIGSGVGGSALTEGAAIFNGVPSIHVNVVSPPGIGATAHAYLFDTFTFSVVGGGSTLVPIRMTGDWGGLGGSVRATLGLGLGGDLPMAFHAGVGSADESPGEADFARSGDAVNGYFGNYAVDALWHVADGESYSFFAGVYAQSVDGGRVRIGNPITISLPHAVSFTTASGNRYASPVPETPGWLMLCVGLAALAGRHATRRAPSGA
ncbi:hypothetical protein [Rivibacter subsaxonicus]|uniref:Secreted protein with PEP-CTERM sorting signal n=1 Tax=Rivibacter subsaxonicus TaxID=457575 RepID=A0A4Q7VD49_9BURK|nr:hypothetical protein [Rivibacter subsaxonicus]RZT93817.1 hypothetical protein EV670_3373 [Rivibacter subsaxonicus]